MVPEEDNKPGSSSESEDSKVKIDDQEVSDSSVKSNQKVELDLDDAPFLDWEEDSEEEEAGEEEKEVAKGEEEQEEEEKEKKEPVFVRIKRWWWVWAAAAALLLLVSVSVVMWFVSEEATSSKKEKLPQVVEGEKPKAGDKNETKQMKQVSLEPFWVEYNTNNTYTHLHLGIDLGVQGEKPAWELEKKVPVIRDSLYYFLKNKQIAELADKNNIKDLKKEIQGIVNNNLSQGKVDQVLVQKYLVE